MINVCHNTNISNIGRFVKQRMIWFGIEEDIEQREQRKSQGILHLVEIILSIDKKK